jgi:hypothetical protein
VKSLFLDPPAAYRGKPLWAWNSRLAASELKRQVGVFAGMGMGGFFMHSRVGLATEYLGAEWFRLIRSCAKEGARLGLESWLYDEDRWPSGSAGGLVTADLQYRMRYLRCVVNAELPPGSEFVAAFAGRLDGLRLDSYRVLETASSPLRRGESRLLFGVETVQPHGFFNGGTYLDTLNPEAVRRFFDLTHERYRRHCGEMFGSAVPGIFTDEPHRGFVMADTPEGWTYPRDSRWVTPWTGAFTEKFHLRFGWDLRERLPELFFQFQGKRISAVKWQYMEVLHALFLESWAKPYAQWCKQHGLRLTGHMLGEESPGAQAITCGSAMRYYEHLETPGMDLLGRENRAFWIAKQVQSSARQFGRKWTMSELYGCTGWQTTFADHKEIGDWQAFLGINLRCHHLSWYTMAGEAKRDFPASIFFQSNWHREYKAVEDYYARLHLALQQGRAVCDLLVLHPVESQWAQVRVGWAGWIRSQAKESERLDGVFEKTFRWITAARVDFDYADEEQLGRLGRIEKSDALRLRLGRGSYRAVLVCGLETMRSNTLRLLRDFRAAGGEVIFAGRPPSHVDALPSREPRAFSETAVRVAFSRDALTEAVVRAVPPLVRLENSTPHDLSRPILLQTRRAGRAIIVGVCNTDRARSYAGVRAILSADGGTVEEWNCRTGERTEVPQVTKNRRVEWEFDLPPLGERIFRISPPRPARRVVRHETVSPRAVSVPGPYAYRLDEPNALVLDRFRWRTGRGEWLAAADILEIDCLVRERFGWPQRSLGMVQPWARSAKPASAGKRILLAADFETEESFLLTLAIEQPARWQIVLNGVAVPAPPRTKWFVDPCFRMIPLPRALVRSGRNTLELSAALDESLDLEAVYLLGKFGVYRGGLNGWKLSRLPSRLEASDACAQGLPFYSGRIGYVVPVPAGARQFAAGAFGGVAMRLVPGGSHKPHILAFPPWESGIPRGLDSLICEVLLSRRNLFGPLHGMAGDPNFVGPHSFRPARADYLVEPQLEASGLLESPVFSH